MRTLKSILAAVALLALPSLGLAAEGLPAYAPVLVDLGFFKITNSMVVTWIVALFLIVGAQMATSKLQRVPSGLQNLVEWIVESLESFLAGLLGPKLARETFWFYASVFLFILFANWFGLIPGVGSVGFGSHADGQFILPTFHHVDRPLFRGANADLNMTSAMAMVFFFSWVYWAVKANGVGGTLSHIFGYHGDAVGGMKAFLVVVFLMVGLLEVISIVFRPVSLSFRLYGNIFAGENLLEAMAIMGGKWFGWLVPLPFYLLELLVGFVQALVFTLLTAIFTQLICSHGDGDHAHEEAGHEHH